jgi:hypothetical protein
MINQIALENKIINKLNEDNLNQNTFHFIWSKNDDGITLDIVSCNSKNEQQFLLLKQEGTSFNNCLEKALVRIKKQFPLEYSWIVQWVDINNNEQLSYFIGADEDVVRNKFYFHNINSTIIKIEKQPIS